MHFDQATSFSQRALGIEDIEEARGLFADHVRSFGIDGFGYGGLDATGHLNPERIVTTLPGAWLNQYINNDYAKIDPAFAMLRQGRVPFQWSRTFARDQVGPEAMAVIDLAGQFGLTDGIVFGIPGPKGLDAAAVLTSSGPAGSLNETFDRGLAHLHIAVLEFHLVVRSLLERRASLAVGCRLTSRERECYLWTARGKSSWEIGQILGISERTVVFHIDNVKRKLGVGSRMQALVKLVMSGEIEP